MIKIYPNPEIFKPLEDTYEHVFRSRLNEFTSSNRKLISKSFTLRSLLMENNYKQKIEDYIDN